MHIREKEKHNTGTRQQNQPVAASLGVHIVEKQPFSAEEKAS